MDKFTKQNYNQSYYAKNRAKILARARKLETLSGVAGEVPKAKEPRPKSAIKSNVHALFSPSPKAQDEPKAPPKTPPRKKQSLPQLETALLGTLIVAMGYYLVHESAQFYLLHEGNRAQAYLKALILEGAAITFSVVTSRTWVQAVAHKLLLAMIYGYTVWLLSSSILQVAVQHQREYGTQQQMIREFEVQIVKADAERDRFWKLDRVSWARRTDSDLKDLRLKLNQLREQNIQTPNPATTWNTVLTLVVFRILVMASSLFCLQILGRRLCWREGLKV